MSVIVLTSATGSPGVTTTALGLALTWPKNVLLADCDRDPAQAIQAGYLRGMDHGGRGLMALAHLHRQGAPLGPELWRNTLPLTSTGAQHRRYLPGFSTAGSARLFDHVWPPLGEAFSQLGRQEVDVLVDAGRITSAGLPSGLLMVADIVVMVVRSSLRSLAGARIHLATLTDQVHRLHRSPECCLAIVGAGRPYAAGEISSQFGLPCWLELPWDPKSAEVLSDGEPPPRRFHEATFMGRHRASAKSLSERLAHAQQRTAEITGAAS